MVGGGGGGLLDYYVIHIQYSVSRQLIVVHL